jgi:hypothetical protein
MTGVLLEPHYILLETYYRPAACGTALRGHLHHDHHKRNLALLKQIRAKRNALLKSYVQPDGHLR